MKKLLIVMILLLLHSFPTTSILAAPPEEELWNYLQNLGWTKDELHKYLSLYELSIEDFETMNDLVEVLGTPLNESNVHQVLDNFELTIEDLDDLLSQFGESTEDYTFVEDLNKAISYYMIHAEAMAGMTDFLSYIGVTEAEMTELFAHIGQLEKNSLQTMLQEITDRIDSLGPLDETNELTEGQQKELLSIFEDVMIIYQLNPTFKLSPIIGTNNETISYNKLTEIEDLNGRSVNVSLFTNEGILMADMSLSSDMLASDFVLQASEQFAQVGQLATNMNSFMYGDMLPETASSYLVNLVYGVILFISGIGFYIFTKKRALI